MNLRLVSVWLITILIAVILTAMITQSEPVEAPTRIEYIVVYLGYDSEVETLTTEPTGAYTGAIHADVKEEIFTVTAYCPCPKCCGEWSDGFTYSGELAHEGVTVAADLNKYPLGTRLYIEGLGERIVQDRGGAINGNKLDVFFYNHEAALQFGRQELRVEVLD